MRLFAVRLTLEPAIMAGHSSEPALERDAELHTERAHPAPHDAGCDDLVLSGTDPGVRFTPI